MTKRVEIGEDTFELLDWSVDDGDLWCFRLTKIVLASAADGGGTQSFVGLLDHVDEKTFFEFRAACLKYTQAVLRDDAGKELRPLLSKKPQLLHNKFDVLVGLMKAHLEVQFNGPFSRAPAVLMGGGSPKTDAVSASPSG